MTAAELSRSFTLELKRAPDAAGVFEGYASTFGGPPDMQDDIIARGAFAKSLDEHKARGTRPAMLWMHDPERPIGTWLAITEDSRGLAVTGRLVLESEKGAEAYALMKAGALAGLSIGYRTRDAAYVRAGVRELRDIELLEVSIVSVAANPRARVTAVKAADIRSFEAQLRDVLGFTQREAKRLAAGGWPALSERDVHRDGLSALASAIRADAVKLSQTQG